MLKALLAVFNFLVLGTAAVCFCVQIDLPSKAVKKFVEHELSRLFDANVTIDKLNYTASFSPQEWWDGHLHIDSIEGEGIRIDSHPAFAFAGSIDADWRTGDGHLFVTKAACSTFSLAHPVEITYRSGCLKWNPLQLTLEKGHISVKGSYQEGEVKAIVDLIDLPLPAGGLYSAGIHLEGKLASPTASASIEFKDVPGLNRFPAAHGKLTAFFNEGVVMMYGIAKAGDLPPLTVDAKLPYRCSLLPFTFEIDSAKELHVAFSGASELIPIAQLFFDSTVHFNGQLKFQGNIGGTIAHPVFKAQAEISNGTYESYVSGALFKDIHAALYIENNTLYLQELAGIDTNIGTVTGTGEMNLLSDSNFPFTLALDFEKVTLVRLDHAGAVASGQLRLTGNSNEGNVTGELIAESAVILLDDTGSSSAKTLDITYINQSKEEEAPTLFTKQQIRWPLALDISIRADKNLWITNRDLSSEWEGTAKLQGTLEAPILFGDIKIQQGTYLFNGKAFDIREGTISFNGDPETKTSLYVIAQMEIEDAIAEIILKGPVKSPAIALRSNPPLPPKEIVSGILFGRGSTEITPFQGAQLSKSITNLKTGTAGPDLLSRIRNTLGIDRLEINRTGDGENGETSLKIGKYLTRRVFIAVNKSMTSEVNRLMIEATLRKNLKVQAEIGDDYEGQLHLKWKHDY